jgi:hypothetical protein
MFDVTTENFIMYVVLGLFTIFVWYVETKDIKCPTFSSSQDECENGGGMAFSYTKPAADDSCQKLIEKIYKGAGAEQASIKWRRSFTLSVSIMVVMWVLVGSPGRLPDWKTLYLSVLISYVIIFGSFNYYSYHVFGKAESWMKDSIKELEKKGCIKTSPIL